MFNCKYLVCLFLFFSLFLFFIYILVKMQSKEVTFLLLVNLVSFHQKKDHQSLLGHHLLHQLFPRTVLLTQSQWGQLP